MLHPVGSHSPAVYWRRRLVLLAGIVLLVLLIVLTARAVLSGGNGKPGANSAPPSGGTSSPGPSATSPAPSSPASTSATTSGTPSGSATAHSSGASSSAPPATCQPAQLQVKAVVAKSQYAVGDEPLLALQVTNVGPAPCIQNVADSQIELRVYNGASRVWGSHDCMIQPGTDLRTLAVNQPASFSIQWTGLTSQPGCAGTRQRVGAGTYTLYASLSGHNGTAAQFSFS